MLPLFNGNRVMEDKKIGIILLDFSSISLLADL